MNLSPKGSTNVALPPPNPRFNAKAKSRELFGIENYLLLEEDVFWDAIEVWEADANSRIYRAFGGMGPVCKIGRANQGGDPEGIPRPDRNTVHVCVRLGAYGQIAAVQEVGENHQRHETWLIHPLCDAPRVGEAVGRITRGSVFFVKADRRDAGVGGGAAGVLADGFLTALPTKRVN